MRIGKPSRRSRAWKKAGSIGGSVRRYKWTIPRHISPETVVGQVSSDVISTVYAPKLKLLAIEAVERYANEMLIYEEALAAWEKDQSNNEVDVEMDGNYQQTLPPTKPMEPLYHSQSSLDRLDSMFVETSEHFMMASGGAGWKVHVNAARFERSLDEKYGIFRPFVTDHPEIELFIRSIQRKYAMGYFSPIRKPPIPRATAVILLFMLQRGKLRWEIMVLATLFFLVGLQPWALVAVICILQALLYRRKRKTIGRMPRKIVPSEPYYQAAISNEVDTTNTTQRKHDILLQPVGSPIDRAMEIDTTEYDVMMIGHGPGTLFAAALLSRAGRKVLVLSSRADASGCITCSNTSSAPEPWRAVPFDVDHSNIARISRQQELLAPALVSATDYQGGIRFAQIGCAADGYAFEILAVPGMGADGGGDHHHQQPIPFILKAAGGVSSLMEDAASYLGDNWPESDTVPGDSRTGQFVAACDAMNANASLFYLSKILPESVNKLRANTSYHDAALRNCTNLLNSCFPLNAHLRSLMAAIGMKGENLQPSGTSMAAHISNICAAINDEGMYYPVGGPRALCHALAHVITSCGGRVVTDAAVCELVFDETIPTVKSKSKDEPSPPFCVGVKLRTEDGVGKIVRFVVDRYKLQPPHCPVVISMEGFIHTFIRLLPNDIRTVYKVPRGVPALSERRPVIHFLYILDGTAADLNVTGADYYRLPGAAVAHDVVDATTGEITYGVIGWSDEDHVDVDVVEVAALEDTTNKTETNNDETTAAPKSSDVRRKKKRAMKFETDRSWIRIAFPSAKDPSFDVRYGNITTCVVTIEADDDFVMAVDTKPRIFVNKKATASSSGDIQRLTERVKKDLLNVYPQLEGKILHSEISGPYQKGLSHNPERYVARGIRADTPYPGLYAGGSDLTVGDSFSGSTVGAWLVANAVCDYKAVDHLFLRKDIISDLEQFLVAPPLLQDEDVAVPFTPRTVPHEEEEMAAEDESNKLYE